MESDAAVSSDLIVAIQICWTIVRGDQEIEVAVAVEVAIGKAATNFGLVEVSSSLGGNIVKAPLPIVEEKLCWLCVSHIAANVADGFVDVPVGDGKVEPAVEVNVEKGTAEPETVSGGDSDSGLRSDIFETLPARAIESDHLVVKVRDCYTGGAGVVEIGDVNAHSRARFSFAAESEPGLDGGIFEGAIALVAIELIRLRVVGDKEVGPAVVIFVEQCHAERFRTAVEDSATGGDVFECAVAAIVEEPAGGPPICFGRAVRLVLAVETAEHVRFRRPLHVIADVEIEQAVTVIVKPNSRGAEAIALSETGGIRYVDEGPLARVAEEVVLADAGY